MGIKLRDNQAEFVNGIYGAWTRCRSVLGVLATGGGKCLGKGTPVLMFDGTVKPVESVREGDLLMGPDSKPRTVQSVCTGSEMLYRVTPVKGDPYVVNESHILSLKRTGKRKGEVVNIGVKEYLSTHANFKHVHKGWRAQVSWAESDLPEKLPPYLLGIWLGDGTSCVSSVTTADAEVVEYLTAYAKRFDFPLRGQAQPGNASSVYHITGRGKHTGTLKRELIDLDLINNKHIPHMYQTGSDAQRLELLAGLLDSDGHYTGKGYDIVFKSKALADGLAFVARSLGFSAYPVSCRKTCTNTCVTGTYYRMCVSGDVDRIPTRLARHKPAPRKQVKSVLVTGITVEPIGVGDYYGFEISGDHLFMLGDFTVTHNTFCFSHIIRDHKGASAVTVHRKEIVVQISMSLAALGVMHRIVAPPKVVQIARRKQLAKFGKSFVDAHALCGVISVQTLTSPASGRNAILQAWITQVTLAVFDEGHHYVKEGLWAKAVDLMHNAKLLFVSATPERADGQGLGSHAGGFCDEMVEGKSAAWLIDNNFLSKFRYIAPDTDLDVRDIAVGKNGDFNAGAMRARVVESHLVGDVVTHYKQFAAGKRAIVFATDVETAQDMANAFAAAGFTSEALSGNTDQGDRDRVLTRFERGEVDVLVNVDLFDEGFDVPAVECVILARPTQSLAKFLQQCGRGLRIIEGKTEAIIIDPVRNWERHGMPNWPRVWTLDSREKRGASASDTVPQKVCKACTGPYEAFYKQCPYCGFVPVPAERSTPEQVEGDLSELDVDAMAALFKKMNDANMNDADFEMDMISRSVPPIGRSKALKAHKAGIYRREVLHNLVGWWLGMQPEDRTKSEKERRFFYRFGIDMGTAFTLNAVDTDLLADKIAKSFNKDLV